MQAKEQYERARNALAFNVLGAERQSKNQHGTRYWFADGSILVASHSGNYIKWGTLKGGFLAVRKLWDDRGSRVG